MSQTTNTAASAVEQDQAVRPVAREEMSKFQWTWNEMKKNKTAYFMLAPFLILFIIFNLLYIQVWN